MTLKFLWAASLAAMIALAQTRPEVYREGDYWVRSNKGTLSLKGSRRLRIHTPGAVSIKGQTGPNISYQLTERLRARTIEDAHRTVSGSHSSIGRWGDWTDFKITRTEFRWVPELTLMVPRDLEQIAVYGRTGDIELLNLDANVTAESLAGRIVADDLTGTLVAKTGGGEIKLGSVSGPIRCISGGGSIRVERCIGECFLETAGGGIHVGDAKGAVNVSTAGGNIYIERAAASVSARTVEGIIQVRHAGGAVVAETAAGSIEIGNALDARCITSAGAIRLIGISGTLRASTASGDILAELLSGRKVEESSLTTSFGDITVLIPSNLAVTVRANSVPAGVSGTVISEFPEIRVRKTSIGGYGPVEAEGALNGGGPVLTLSAAGGTVYLRRQQ